MSNLYNRIELLCAKKGITITQMCKDCHASRGSLTDLAKGRIQTLSSTTLKKISEYFNVPVDSLSNDVLKFDFVPHYFDDAIITCPICGYEYTYYVRTIGVDLGNEKSFCIALEFMCECGHTFYYVIESYKGNSYILKATKNRIVNITPYELPETDNISNNDEIDSSSLYDSIQRILGKNVLKLIELYSSFNDEGQEKLLDNATDMSHLDRYKKDSQSGLAAEDA